VTSAERILLPSLIDQVVFLKTVQGDHLLVQILFVFDEGGETPDLFCLEVESCNDGGYVQKGTPGLSILLSDILSVQPPA
jgi:hypothetical protein